MQKQITTERRRQLAVKHKVNVQYLYQCLTGRRDMNPAEAMRVETESGKELTRQMLCQKTYAGIWPDLLKDDGRQKPTLPSTQSNVNAKDTSSVLAAAFKDGLIKDQRIATETRRAADRMLVSENASLRAALKGAQMSTTKVFTLPAGTVCKRGGIPFQLLHATIIECHPDNWPLIRDGFKPGVSYGPTFSRSQELQLSAMPRVAQAEGCSPTTSSSSLESSAGEHRSRT